MPSLLSSCWACVHSYLKRMSHNYGQIDIFSCQAVGLGGQKTKANGKSLNTICRRCSTCVSNEHGTISNEKTIGMSCKSNRLKSTYWNNTSTNFWWVSFAQIHNCVPSMKCVFGMLLLVHVIYLHRAGRGVWLSGVRRGQAKPSTGRFTCWDDRLIAKAQMEREIFAKHPLKRRCTKWKWMLCSFWQSSLISAICNPNHNMVFMRLDLGTAFCSDSN